MLLKQARYFKLALKSLRSRSARSWITIIGIVVSIAVILTLLTLSAGLQQAVVALFEDLGTNRIFVFGPDGIGGGPGLSENTLNDDIVRDVRALSSFRLVIPRLIVPAARVEYRGNDRYVTAAGFEASQADDIIEEYNLQKEIEFGRFMRSSDNRVAVIGNRVASVDEDDFGNSFSKQVVVGNTIKISGEDFRVVGIFRKGGDFDDIIIITLDDARLISGKTDEITVFDAVVQDNVNITFASQRLDRLLEKKLGEDNYRVITPDGILRQFTQIIGIVQAVLVAIASVSLIVGAVGIMNTMFTSVLEREKEIGIMKSIGSRNSDILTMFLFESGLIGLVGGFAGAIIGIGISFGVGAILKALNFNLLVININFVHVAGCLFFAFVIGMLSGAIPSYLASRKKIVDTLRDA